MFARVLKDNLRRANFFLCRMKAVRDHKIMKAAGISLQNAAANSLPQFPYNFIYGLQPGMFCMLFIVFVANELPPSS